MKRAIIFIFFIFVNSIYSQIESDTLQINVLGQKQGLLQLNIKGLTQDKQGYVWVGTEDGLHKFNAYNFKPFIHNPEDSLSIVDDHIRDLKAVNGSLYIATNTKGIIGYNIFSNDFFDLNISNENTDVKFGYKVKQLSKELLLFSTKNYILIYNTQTNKSNQIRLPKSEKENIALDFFIDNNHNILIATSNSGVLRLNLNSLKVTTYYSSINKTSAIFKEDDRVYIGTDNGLKIISKNFKIKDTPIKETVRSFYKKGNFLFICTKKGVYKLNLKANKIEFLFFKNSNNKIIYPVDVLNAISDNNGNLWFGTEGEGLFHYSQYQKKFETTKIKLPEFKNAKKISSFNFLKDQDSTLWIASGLGLIKYQKDHFKLYEEGKDNLFYTLKKDENGNVWAGGFGTGLLKYNRENDSFKKLTPSIDLPRKITDNEVIEIIPINKNKLWIATWTAGIFEFDINSEKFTTKLINNKQLNRARISLIDSKKNIWLGTDEGLFKISNHKTKHYTSETDSVKLTSNRIFAIKEDSKNNIWIGTASGLTKLSPKNETTHYYKQEGLPNDFIYSITIDKKDNIWVSTNHGISVLSPETGVFKNYTDKDGLQNIEFNGKAGYQDKYGNFYFGGIRGINIFNPKEINENPHQPKVYIESIDLFNKPINHEKTSNDIIEFKSSENVLTFNYSALNYLNSEKVLYQYKMEGFDKDWRPITSKRTTTYTNLNPGNYTFKVKSTNDVGIWNTNYATVQIKIIPPWYAQLWFKITSILSIIISAFLFYLFQTNKLKRDKIKLENKVTERTIELKEKNNSLNEAYLHVNKQKENISFLMKEMNHRVRNNLQIISSLLNIQANTSKNKETKDILKIAKNRILSISYIQNSINQEENNIDLSEFIKDLSEKIIHTLTDESTLKFKHSYEIQSLKNYPNINTTLIGLILNELITNTFKYAFNEYDDDNSLKIKCLKKENNIEISIIDNGKGYSKNTFKENSLGLELVNEMVSQLNAKIETKTNNGVSNVITIPYI